MWICPKCNREFTRRNQSHYCGEAPKTIEEWILQQERPLQDFFQKLHQVICDAVPDIKQRIAWSMPTYGEKEIVVQFAACKNHVSLYVGEKAIEHFGTELCGYECKKSAVYLRYDQPLPEVLIAKMVKWCYENEKAKRVEDLFMENKIYTMKFAKVYLLLVQKAERKNRTKQEVDRIIFWLTGYDEEGLAQQIQDHVDYKTFFEHAPCINPNCGMIKGTICGVRVETIEDPVIKLARCLDKLVDELAKGKAMDKILRK